MSELPENWREDLPEDMRGNGILDTVKTMDNLVKMAIDGRTLATNSVRIPSEDAAADVRAEFQENILQKMPSLMAKPDFENDDNVKALMRSMGLPEESSGYTLPEIPESLQSNMDKLTESAHAAGLTNKQLNAITEGIVSDFKANTDEAYGALEEQKQALKTEWGAAYDQKVETISHFAKQTGFSEEFVGAIKSGQVDSTNMKAFENVVNGYEGEAVEIGRQPTNPEFIMTPAEADARLNELMGDKDNAYWHPEDPNHQAAKDKVIELGKLAETGEMSESERFRQSLLGG